MWGYTLAFWDRVSLSTLILGMLCGAAAVFLTGLSSIVSLRTSAVVQANTRQETAAAQAEGKRAGEAAALANERAQAAEERAARLEADAAKARERTASLERATVEARVEAAKANARAAEANQAAEQERIARLQMQAKFEWRVIPPEIIDKIRSALPTKPGVVKLAYIANDPESLFLANQIAGVLKAVNWDFYPEAETYYQRLFFGINVSGTDGPAVIGIRRAFDDAGINVSAEDVPVADQLFGPQGMPTPVATILVGSKAPPL